ncbi:MAG: hypothetical protein ACRDHL_06390 [Candidatus Promineifilaceae bacterium]
MSRLEEGELLLAETLLRGWQVVARGQHPSGEMVSFRRDHAGNFQPLRSPFVSTAVHDALACFDPTSLFYAPGCGELLAGRRGKRFQYEVSRFRRRIRGYLAWQQEPAGWWRFFGRGSGIDPDVNTTAAAAISLAERQISHWAAGHGRQLAVVGRFRAAGGCYFTFLKPRRGGYAWLDAKGSPVAGFDRVVNADVLRYLSLAAGAAESEPLLAFLSQEAAGGAWLAGTPIYPNPLSFPFALARAYRQGHAPEVNGAAAALLPAILARQGAEGDFGGPLSTALAASALLDLGYQGPALAAACRALTWALHGEPTALYEDFVIDGFGSPALSAALSIACLARYHASGQAEAA